jgi:heme exporter protein D
MSPIAEYFAMGGHGFYVWTSYAAALVVMVANVVLPILRARRLRHELRGQFEQAGAQP